MQENTCSNRYVDFLSGTYGDLERDLKKFFTRICSEVPMKCKNWTDLSYEP